MVRLALLVLHQGAEKRGEGGRGGGGEEEHSSRVVALAEEQRGLSVPRHPWDAESGRGLTLVRTCSDGWGWVQQPDHKNLVGAGKYIWCDLTNAVA
ncbi:hypothetical protein OG562_21695 [Streptomyces sp. NBC_01275]|uniref:hypothetical protein n=1 Tax=Streptomyces sp. NBC_01275 TaxID=2903807 RepID=UPI00224CF3B1|nr:hypothetical protein [Streptomyces sp. NBC_01275]MCX4763528.1 hypothetical protein [Streptomyces sp. NBC_01275]